MRSRIVGAGPPTVGRGRASDRSGGL